jgi:hypothetical protein
MLGFMPTSDDATPRLSLPYLAAGQAQKHVTLNESLALLDGLVQTAVESRATAAQPASPADGVLYILPASPTGADWSDKAAGTVMRYEAGAWAELPVGEGCLAWVKDEDVALFFDGAAWGDLGSLIDALQGLSLLGVNATADATNKLTVASEAVLFNHAGAGSQVKVNKNAAGDTASHLFQTGFSGRAEFGLAGSDDFSVKVSADGLAWHDVLSADRSSGRMTIAKAPTVTDETPASLTYAASLTPDLDDGRAFLVTLTGNVTLNAPSNLVAGAGFWIRFTQDGTGSRAITFNGAYRFAGGAAPSLTTTAGASDMLYCVVVDAATPVIDAALRKGV